MIMKLSLSLVHHSSSVFHISSIIRIQTKQKHWCASLSLSLLLLFIAYVVITRFSSLLLLLDLEKSFQ